MELPRRPRRGLRRGIRPANFSAMRLVPRCLLLLSLVAACAHAADVQFVRVWPGWRNADTFESISEYFTGRESDGGRVVLRTTPDARAGFYFLVRVANATTPLVGAKFSLQVITPASPDPKSYTFAADVPARSTAFHLGLTGPDWPGASVHPVAWKLELLSADNRILASSQSFLWEKPAK